MAKDRVSSTLTQGASNLKNVISSTPIQKTYYADASVPHTIVTYGDGREVGYKGDRTGTDFAPNVYIHSDDSSIANASPATLKQQPTASTTSKAVASGTTGGSTYNPYGDVYTLYEQQLEARKNAAEQQRQARLGAIQSQYGNAKARLGDAFASGEQDINQNSDRALREAWVDMMLNQRNLNQQLASQGINGGAMESSLARAYNNYGNNRNSIEQNRLDNISSLAQQYQNSLGDIEDSYASNLANVDSDYSKNYLDAIDDYYTTLASLKAQNAAAQYKAALGKKEEQSNTSGLNADVLKVVKGFSSNPAGALNYLRSRGITGDMADEYMWAASIDPTGEGSVATPIHDAIIGELRRLTSAVRSNNNPYGDNIINEKMQQFVEQYGLSEAQARALLAEAGY